VILKLSTAVACGNRQQKHVPVTCIRSIVCRYIDRLY